MTGPSQIDALSAIRGFFAWWREELGGMIPLTWRDRWTRNVPKAVIRPLADRVEIELIDGNEHKLLVDDVPLGALDEDAWAELDGIVRSRRSVLVLSHPDALVVRTSLPPGAVGHAGRVLELQLDRLSPLRPEFITWNWTVVPGPERAEAAVAMVRNETIERLDRLLADHGLPLPAIAATYEPAPVHILGGYDGSETRERRLDRRLGWLALALLASIPFTTLIGLASARSATLGSIELLDTEVAPKIRADARVRRAAREATIVRPLLGRPTATDLLGRMANLLPEGARLAEVTIAPDGLATLVVEGVAADTLEPILTDAFREVTILSPEAAATIQSANPAAAIIPPGSAGPVRVTVEIRR